MICLKQYTKTYLYEIGGNVYNKRGIHFYETSKYQYGKHMLDRYFDMIKYEIHVMDMSRMLSK